MVFLAEDNTAPINWPLFRILKVYPGNDNVIGVVKIKTNNTTLIRPIVKLRPFPGDSSAENHEALNEALEMMDSGVDDN